MNQSDRIEVRSNDVLYGKGKKSFSHAGNMRFRDIITEYLEAYASCSSVSEKSRIVQAAIDAVHALGGRFLRRNQVTDQWMEMQQRHVQDKVINAFRDASRRGSSRAHKITIPTSLSDDPGVSHTVTSPGVASLAFATLPNESDNQNVASSNVSDSIQLERVQLSAKLQQELTMSPTQKPARLKDATTTTTTAASKSEQKIFKSEGDYNESTSSNDEKNNAPVEDV